jgi:3-oxoacyl-[acyl-carrier protein] reductase
LDLAKNGANVALSYQKHSAEAESIAAQINQMGRKGLAIKADVSVFSKAQAVVDRVVKEWGRVDILVCNAGAKWDGVIWKMSEEQWDAVINTNLKGCFNYIKS